MPLIVGGVINSNPQPIEQPAPKQPEPINSLAALRNQAQQQQQPQQTILSARNRNVQASAPRTNFNPNDHLVVVDGKAKKIGKQSKYLLDMLTIDE